jgi:class 3 adenylate cyclase/CheY-like chemotaxis protein
MPRVLIIEDSPTQAAQLALILEDAGFEVETAPDAEQGFARLARAPGSYALVLSDLNLPGDSGFDLCRRIKAEPGLDAIPVVVCTSEADPMNVLRGLQAGADGFMTKDREPPAIVASVKRALDRSAAAASAGAAANRVQFLGREFELSAGRDQLLDILVSAFEDVVRLNQQIEHEKARSNDLLHVILPDQIVRELKATRRVRPRRYENVAVLFADVVNFTAYCETHRAEEVVAHLQQLVESWEEIAVRHEVEKIKTIGDAFMAASGLLRPVANPVLNCLRSGLEMIAAAQALPTRWDLRVGIHYGQVMAGVLGHRQYLFDLFGNTVNEAARLQSHGTPGSIILSTEAWQQVAPHCRGESLGLTAVKGIGELELIRFVAFNEG